MTTRDPLHTPGDDRLARLTRRYARYSHSAGGLASVIGGGLALVAYLMGALAPPGHLWGRLALASTPLVWIAVKELLRHRYYQPLGRVRELRTAGQKRWHLGFTVFTATVSAAVAGVVLWGALTGTVDAWSVETGGYLAVVLVMPVLVWFWMKTPLEFIVGVFLMSQAALMLAGSHYELGEQPQAPLAAAVLVLVGVRQHLEFRRLERELRRSGSLS